MGCGPKSASLSELAWETKTNESLGMGNFLFLKSLADFARDLAKTGFIETAKMDQAIPR